MFEYKKIGLALLGSTMLSSLAFAQQESPVPASTGAAKQQLPTITVSGVKPKGLAYTGKSLLPPGQVQVIDKPYANAVVTRESLDQKPATSNITQAINELPGVNSFSRDATGIFGGGYSYRGFDSSNIGLILSGVPQNDPGTNQIYPELWVDAENICQVVLQDAGANPSENSVLGDVGGTLDITLCRPADHRTVKYVQTVGGNATTQEFIRLDTGNYGNGLSSFVSYSRSHSDLKPGSGVGDRDHIDAETVWALSPGNTITFDGYWNQEANTQFRNPTLAQYEAQGYQGYGSTPPAVITGSPAVVGPEAPNTAAITTSNKNLYYADFINPTLTWDLTAKGVFTPADNVTLTVQPFWLVTSTGSSGLTAWNLTTGAGTVPLPNGTRQVLGAVNNSGQDVLTSGINRNEYREYGLNNEAAFKSSFACFSNSFAIGINAWLNKQIYLHPLEVLSPDGNVPNNFWSTPYVLLDKTGNVINTRNWDYTETTLTPYISDHATSADGALELSAGLQTPLIKRSFTNLPSDQNQSYEYYNVNRTFRSFLPSAAVSYNIAPLNQVFASFSISQELPPAYADSDLINKTNGNLIPRNKLVPEKARAFDIGYRYSGSQFGASITGFHVDFTDRVNTITNTSGSQIPLFINTGSTEKNGVEGVISTNPLPGLHTFTTATIDSDVLQNNIIGASGNHYATKGKEFFNTPHFIGAAGFTYEIGQLSFGADDRYVSGVYSTLTNDQHIGGYDVADLNISYKLAKVLKAVKDPVISLTVDNLTNTKYLFLTGVGSGGPQINAAANPTYYYGNPLFIGATFSASY